MCAHSVRLRRSLTCAPSMICICSLLCALDVCSPRAPSPRAVSTCSQRLSFRWPRGRAPHHGAGSVAAPNPWANLFRRPVGRRALAFSRSVFVSGLSENCRLASFREMSFEQDRLVSFQVDLLPSQILVASLGFVCVSASLMLSALQRGPVLGG